MTNNPFISIIVPVYNVSQYIEGCISSIYKQTYTNYEVIIVDDCGMDDSMNKVYAYLRNLGNPINTKVIKHNVNKGLSAARNTGVKNANGTYVFFLDSDDQLAINAFELFNLNYCKFKDCDFYIGDYKLSNNKFEYSYSGIKLQSAIITGKEIYDSYIRGDWHIMAWGKFIKREFFIHNNLWFPEGKLHEDILFTYKLAYYASSMSYIEEEVYIYNIRENSITTHKSSKNYIDILWTIEQIILMNIDKPYKKTEAYIISLLFGMSVNIASSKLSTQDKLYLIGNLRDLTKEYCSTYKLHPIEYTKILLLKLEPHIQNIVFKVLAYTYSKVA